MLNTPLNYNRILRSDTKKLIIFWSEKSGCCTATAMFFKYIGYRYDNNRFIQLSRSEYQDETGFYDMPENYENYIIFQIVRNSYSRAVSSYLVSRTRSIDYYNQLNNNDYFVSPVANNLSFIEFLQTILQQKTSDLPVDSHYDIQTMKDSHIPISQNNIVYLETYKKDIKKINKKYNINLDSKVRYDIHSHYSIFSTYQFLYHTEPPQYKKFFKDPKAKNLVEHIYNIDIENFKFKYPY